MSDELCFFLWDGRVIVRRIGLEPLRLWSQGESIEELRGNIHS